jgi:hypothetical protein
LLLCYCCYSVSTGQIDIGSTHSADEPVSAPYTVRARGSSRRRRYELDGDEEDGGDTLGALATPPRPARPTVAARGRERYRSDDTESDFDTDTGADNALQLEMSTAPRRNRSTQPRGATVVDFTVTSARTAPSAPPEEIVEITPRSVYIAGTASGRPSLTPVARAHLVAQQVGSERGNRSGSGVVSVAPVAVVLATVAHTRGGHSSDMAVASAEAIYS